MDSLILGALVLWCLTCIAFIAYRVTVWLERLGDWWMRL